MDRNTLRTLAVLIGAHTLVIGGIVAGSVTAHALPPCPTEDSVGCTWDADLQGNGEGRSFTVTDDGVVTYEARP